MSIKKTKLRLMAEDPHCWYCGNKLARFPDDYEWSEAGGGGYILWNHTGLRPSQCDHQEPRSRGGSSRPENIVLSCPRCNQSKLARSLEEYRDALEAEIDLPVTFYGEVSL